MNSHQAVVADSPRDQLAKTPKFMERLRAGLRRHQFAPDRVEPLASWVSAFIKYNGFRHPRELGRDHVTKFLAHVRGQDESTPQHEASARRALAFLFDVFLPEDEVQDCAGERETQAGAGGERETQASVGTAPAPTRSPFLNRCHEILRLRHYSLRTEQCYVNWIKRYILYHGTRHPQDGGRRDRVARRQEESAAFVY